MTGWSGLSKYTFPAESTATPHTWGIVTEVAGAAVDGRAPPAMVVVRYAAPVV
jgi:hypothetical protein